MKKFFISYLLLLCLCITGCLDKPDLSPDANDLKDADIDLSFAFKTRTNSEVNITTINSAGERIGNILFSIYTQNPYIKQGGDVVRDTSINPIYRGYTEKNGSFSREIAFTEDIETLYIVPEYPGFGFMKEVSLSEAGQGITLKGFQINALTNRSLSTYTEISRNPIKLGTNTTFFHYFTYNEFNSFNGSLNVGIDLVSYDPLSDAFMEEINNFFPEQKANYTGEENNTDLYITSNDGAEFWVTYIGDGGFATNSNSNICNGMYYYTYTNSNKPSKPYSENYLNSSEYRLTAIFPNANPRNIAAGTKVQLLYWDNNQNKYVSRFPKGTYIGFALNYKGYNENGNVTLRGFSLWKNENNPYCSTKEFNVDGKTHAITHWNEKFNCYIIGMEREGIDNDYNDLMAKITINEKQELTGSVTPPTVAEITYSQSGTLAFEDNWPYMGDYDFNDFVVEYTYTLKKKEVSNKITNVNLKFIPKASGGANNNGFGIQLPIKRSDIAVLPQNVTVETDIDPLSMIIYENVQDGFPDAPKGFINTVRGSEKYDGAVLEIDFELQNPIDESELAFETFNPFLITGSRNHEIHLVDYQPTSKMNMKLFGVAADYSDPSMHVYYRMDNNYPWALDIADVNWKWAYESLEKGIVKVYPSYAKWYTNYKAGISMDWTNEVNKDFLW